MDSDQKPEKPDGPLKVVQLHPRRDEAYKPSELIQITGHQTLSLNARRAITVLWHNAHLSGVEEGKDYIIEIDDLKPDHHKGYEMVEEAIEALMRSILILKLPDGGSRRVQFLGGNDLDSPDRAAGTLTYSFDKRLVDVLNNSNIWGKINIPVLMAFSSKYAISLYENVAQRAGLRKQSEQISLEDFRSMLGVEEGRYPMFGALNKHVIKPAVAEINALAPFSVGLLPTKTGKRVTGVMLTWFMKEKAEADAAWKEVGRSKIGRKHRIAGTADMVMDPMPSINRIVRNDRKNRDPNSSQ